VSDERGGDPIFVLDELVLVPGALEPFLEALEKDYRPGAEARGQRLLHRWVTPPTTAGGVAHTVVLVWQLRGVEGFWKMRSQNSTPEIAAWWADAGRFFVSRTRRWAAEADGLPALDALGRINA
jgi:hypothetical protein